MAILSENKKWSAQLVKKKKNKGFLREMLTVYRLSKEIRIKCIDYNVIKIEYKWKFNFKKGIHRKNGVNLT